MRLKKVYRKSCARLIPYQRKCANCKWKRCGLRYEPDIDGHEEKATTMFNEDQKDHITESLVLGN